jgi:collagen type III alpha
MPGFRRRIPNNYNWFVHLNRDRAMPVIAAKPNPGAKLESEVDRQIEKIVRRIRLHDACAGVALLAVIVLGYVALAMVLDRWLELPDWSRQLGFVGLLAASGAIAWYAIARPLRRTVNPLYAAKEVEDTAEEAKNSVVNWVDLHDKPMNESVRAAVAARAARLLKEADLDKAGESKRLLYFGWSVGVLVVVFAALFMVFKPVVFTSLLGRAVNPFSSGAIATRTQLTLVEPAGGDLTVTAGQPVTVAVDVGGKVPDAEAPDRLRVLLRHNLADANYDELPLEPADATRRWTVRLAERHVQNGFWYKVAGGDAETPEYRVTVRPKPTFTAFDVRYEYPEYLRMKADSSTTPHIEAHRGTVVTILAKANRELKNGRAAIANQPAPVPGEVVGEAKDSLRLKITLGESTTYRLLFQSTEGESNADAPVYDLRVLVDQPPEATIANPKDDETVLPTNGLLSVDGAIGDDFGIDRVALRVRLLVPNGPARNLAGKPYQNGESFRRAADGTFPTALEYKDSIALDKLTDEAGQPVTLKPDAVIEYWIEATDNCTVPTANVGKSKVQRVRLVAPKEEPKQKGDIQQQAEKRKQDEAAHRQDQKKKLEKEDRPAKPSPRKPNEQPNEEKAEGQPGEKAEGQPGAPMPKADPMGAKGQPDPGKAGEAPMAEPKAGEPKAGEPKAGEPKAGEPKAGEPKAGEPKAGEPKAGEPMPKAEDTPENKELRQKAEEIQKKIDDEQKQSGDAKPQPDAKQQPMAGGGKKGPPMDAAAEPKPAGDEKSTEPEEKPGPLGGGSAGAQKPTPKDANDRADKQAAEQAARDLAGNDEGKKQSAREELDKQIGEENRKLLEKNIDERRKTAEGLNSKDPMERAKAEENTTKLQREAMEAEQERNAKTRDREEGDAEQLSRKKDIEQAVKDLNSKDPMRQERGKEKLDELVGKDARKDAENLRDQLKSGDMNREQAAQDELNKMKKQAEQKGANEKAANDKKLEQAAKDVAGNDAGKKEAAKKEIDKQLGQGAGDKAEQAANEKKDAGPKEREQAAKNELAKQKQSADQKVGKGEPSPEEKAANQQKLEKAAKDLAGNDLQKKQDAKKEIDKQLGQGAGDKAEQKLNERQQAAGKQQSGDPKEQQEGDEESQKLQRELTEEAFKNAKSRKNQSGDADQLTRREEMEQAAKDLNSDDPKKKEAAEKKLDELVGKDAREKAKQLGDDLKSGDKDKQKAAVDELQKMKKELDKQNAKNEPKPSPEDKANQDQLEKAAKDAAGNDPAKKDAAKKELDQKLGQGAGDKVEEAAKKDPNANPMQREQAAKDELAKQQQAADQKKAEQAAKDVAGNDPAKKEAAKKELDKQFGKGAGDELEKKMKERQDAADKLQSKDEAERKQGEAKAEQMQKDELAKAAEEKEQKETEKAAKDLMSDDKAKSEAARKKLEEKFGKEAVDKAKQLGDDLKSGDKDRQKAAMDELKKLQEQAEQQAKKDGKPEGKELSPEEIEKLAQAAKDLNSPDANKKKDAEKQLDDKLGENGRKQVEDMLKDGKEPSKEQMDAAKKLMEQLAKNNPGRGANDNQRDPRKDGGIGNTADTKGTPLEANKDFDKQAGQLQLEKLKKAEANKEMLKKLGYTEEEYKRFLDGYEKMVKEAPEPKVLPADAPKPGEPAKPTVRVDGAGRVEQRADGSKSGTSSAGVSNAPPGYGDARKKFAESATKQKDEKK